jgi:3-oxoacyl-[acyl-carrier-protein] synthase II
MKIQGIGIVSALGRGIETFQSALENGSVEPSYIDVPFQDALFPVFRVAAETLKDPALLRGARRADRFSKMATLAAADAVHEAGVTLDPARTGLVLGTAFGPHPTVFSFLDEILEFGDASVSPTLFSHSVHNAAASYISVALGLAGPATTITAFSDPFKQSLQVAQNWLEQNVCDSVLVGAVEECGAVMEYVVSEKLPIADGAIRPFFDPDGPQVIPGEGAVFFLLSRNDGSVQMSPRGNHEDEQPDFYAIDFESRRLAPDLPSGCWSYLVGTSPVSTAVSCAAGALMIRRKTVYSRTDLLQTGIRSAERIGFAGYPGGWMLTKKRLTD